MKKNQQNQTGQWVRAIVLSVVAAAIVLAAPTVYPTGVTTYEPDRSWNGFTVLSPLGGEAAIVIDMNGNVVKSWEGYVSSAGGPNRVLPGGVLIGAMGTRPGRLESRRLVERGFDGKELWSYDHNLQIDTPNGETSWSSRQHHDWQRPDFPAGYYSPGIRPDLVGPKTLLLTHIDHPQPSVTPEKSIQDDRLIEIAEDGELLWEWVASDHIGEMQFDDAAREAISEAAGGGRGNYDWLHLNSATYVGPNHWYDEGDARFNPENIIVSSRQASLVAIVARDGSIVWQIGPDYRASEEMSKIRQIIGQHHAHIIPRGLPGAGNLMIFDNGGASGYGAPTPAAPKGENIFARPTSRVLEINPVTLELVWSYNAPNFFATNISGAQRLANGNTLITEGPDGRIFEVTSDGDIVWEYIYPVYTGRGTNSVYRAYRVPYDWIPQLDRPAEKAVTPPDKSEYRVP